jgi:hypothetical protein
VVFISCESGGIPFVWITIPESVVTVSRVGSSFVFGRMGFFSVFLGGLMGWEGTRGSEGSGFVVLLEERGWVSVVGRRFLEGSIDVSLMLERNSELIFLRRAQKSAEEGDLMSLSSVCCPVVLML